MPLRKSPVRTPALLAANRANALKSTGPRTPSGKARVWSFRTRLSQLGAKPRAKPECALFSWGEAPRVISRTRIWVDYPYRRIGVAFWLQRRRYPTPVRVKRMLAGLEPVVARAADEGLENRVRRLVFRLRRPGYFERLRYSLDRNGDPDWSRPPWRSLPPIESNGKPRPASRGGGRRDAGLAPTLHRPQAKRRSCQRSRNLSENSTLPKICP